MRSTAFTRISGASGRRAAATLLACAGVAAGVSSASAAAGGIARYLQQKGDEQGFNISPGIQSARSVTRWVNVFDQNSGGAADSKRWRAEHFLAGAFVQTISPNGNDQGVSWVEQYGTSAGARAEAAFVATRQLKSAAQIHFKVSRIPGAYGIGFLESSKVKVVQDTDIVWTEGHCALVIGNGTSTGSVSVSALTAAAEKIYSRTHGSCPS